MSLAPFHGGAPKLQSRPPSPLVLTRVASVFPPLPDPYLNLSGFRVPFKVEPFGGPTKQAGRQTGRQADRETDKQRIRHRGSKFRLIQGSAL